jgi:hypothetical protein
VSCSFKKRTKNSGSAGLQFADRFKKGPKTRLQCWYFLRSTTSVNMFQLRRATVFGSFFKKNTHPLNSRKRCEKYQTLISISISYYPSRRCVEYRVVLFFLKKEPKTLARSARPIIDPKWMRTWLVRELFTDIHVHIVSVCFAEVLSFFRCEL